MFKTKTNVAKRVSAFLLALTMLVGTLPLNVFAEGLQKKTSDPVVVDSKTIKEDAGSEGKNTTKEPKKHIIRFDANGGSGEMKDAEVTDGENYTLPNNEFKAPEGKQFKSWLIEDQKQKEGYTLVVTRNLEIKAQWEDVKENPIKKALNSLLGKENKEKLNAKAQSAPNVKEDALEENNELEISKDLASEAVGIANGEWVELSKDPGKTHKIKFTGFEENKGVFKVSIEGIANTTGEYKLFLSAPATYYLDIRDVVDRGLDASKSNEENREFVKKAHEMCKDKRDGLVVYYPPTSSSPIELVDSVTHEVVGNIYDGNRIVINNIPKDAKTLRYTANININDKYVESYDPQINANEDLDLDVIVVEKGQYGIFRSYPVPEDGPLKIGNIKTRRKINSFMRTLYLSKGYDLTGQVLVDNFSIPSYYEEYAKGSLYLKSDDGSPKFLAYGAFIEKELPNHYITKGNKLKFSIEIINPKNFKFIPSNGVDSVYISKTKINKENLGWAREEASSSFIGVAPIKLLYKRNPNLFDTDNHEKMIKEGAHEVRNADDILTDISGSNGNLSFSYYNEGPDKRNLVDTRQTRKVDRFNRALEDPGSLGDYFSGRLMLTNLSLINKDGSYDIPFVRYKVMRGNKVLENRVSRLKGKINIPSGKAFSELYKVTTDNGVIEKKEIPIEEQRVPDDTMLKGEEKVVQEGEKGIKKITADITYLNGKEYNRENEKEEIIKLMKPRIIHYGTAEKLVNKTTEVVKYDTIYEADETLNYEEKKTTQQGKDGSKEVTTTTTLVEGKRQESKDEVATVKPTPEIIKVGNKKVNTEKLPFKTIEEIDKTLKEGETKIKVKGVEGLKTTTTIYEVDKETGKLLNPKETVTTKDPVDQIVLKGTKPDPIKTAIQAKVNYFGVGGAEEKPEAGKFKFILKDSEGNKISEATNDEYGNIIFDELNITEKEVGSHKYTVEQVKGDDPTIKYDTHIEDVTVDVDLSDNNKLSAKVTYDKDGAVFENRLNTTSLQFVRLKAKEDPFVADEVKNEKGVVVSHTVSEKDKSKTLDGAEYDIYQINGDGTETKISHVRTENGISNLVENLTPGKYKLVETKAPEGYFAASKDLEFEITKEDAGKALVKFVSSGDENSGSGNEIMEMPSTGGQGTKALMIGGGILLIVMAGLFVIANKKKKELNK